MGSTALAIHLSNAAQEAGYGGRGGLTRLHRELRDSYGLTTNLQSLSNWLNGERQPELPHLRALLDALGVHGERRRRIVDLVLPEGLLPVPPEQVA